MNLKQIRWILTLVCSLAALSLTAQQPDLLPSGFAGKDKEVLFPEDEVGTKSCQLGVSSYQKRCLFYWEVISAPDGAYYSLSNVNIQQPVLTFDNTEGAYTVQVTRVSKYGYQHEYVMVTVVQKIDLLDAIAVKGCYQKDDIVEPSHFIFTTLPEGYESFIQVHELDKKVGENNDKTGQVDVRFFAEMNGKRIDFETTGTIFVSSGDDLDLSELISNVRDLPKNFNEVKNFFFLVKNCEHKFEKLKNLPGFLGGITSPGILKMEPPKVEPNFKELHIYESCCNDKPTCYLRWNGGIEASAGMELNVPLWPGIPGTGVLLVGELSAAVDASIQVELATDDFRDCYKVSIPFGASGTVAIGLKFSLIDPDIVSIGGDVYGSINGGGAFNIAPLGIETTGIYLTGGMEITGTLLGFSHQFFDYSFGKYYLFDTKPESYSF